MVVEEPIAIINRPHRIAAAQPVQRSYSLQRVKFSSKTKGSSKVVLWKSVIIFIRLIFQRGWLLRTIEYEIQELRKDVAKEAKEMFA